ncbi:hypothetical protein OTU49_017461 [Cherax quadricarinatus]|uniref:Uncharacterized protein n=1 Tax=Cherax quadricarinatus TaxID=27406 RepID=A0AAW0YC70_CHEQU
MLLSGAVGNKWIVLWKSLYNTAGTYCNSQVMNLLNLVIGTVVNMVAFDSSAPKVKSCYFSIFKNQPTSICAFKSHKVQCSLRIFKTSMDSQWPKRSCFLFKF